MENQYSDIFKVELECWCHGLQRIHKDIDQGVLHRVVKEFSPVLREALQKHYAFDLVDTAQQLVTAAKSKVEEKEMVFHLMSFLPPPSELTSEQAEILTEVVTAVERTYPGAVKRMEKKWGALKINLPRERSGQSMLFNALFCPRKSA